MAPSGLFAARRTHKSTITAVVILIMVEVIITTVIMTFDHRDVDPP